MRVWSRYFRAYTKQIVVYFLFCAIFLLTFALYDLPLAAVLYPTAICTVLGLVILILNFISFAARHKELLALYSEATVTVKRRSYFLCFRKRWIWKTGCRAAIRI